MQNIPQIPKKTHYIKKTLLGLLGVVLLLFVITYVQNVVSIRNEILSDEYGLDQFGGAISGAGGANLDNSRGYQLATEDDPSVGPFDAPVVIVEFGDFECPFCGQAFPIIRKVTSDYPESVRHVYRDFPLNDIHPNATLAAQAGYCAHTQNRFWELHDKLFQNQNDLSRQALFTYARQVGINLRTFETCIDSPEAIAEVDADVVDGLTAGALGTPTWFINGVRVAGVLPENLLKKIVEDIITHQNK